MRVALVHYHLGPGGVTRVIEAASQALAAAGIEATSNPEAVTLANAGIEHLRGLAGLLDQGVASTVDRAAVEGLKFSAALPLELAISTLSERGSDALHARAVIEQPIVVRYE